jgi:hypothetical protein
MIKATVPVLEITGLLMALKSYRLQYPKQSGTSCSNH